MGAVFFAILILITSIISIGLLCFTIVLIITTCVMKGKKKKVRGLKTASIVFSSITIFSLCLPVGSMIFLHQMYVAGFPTEGKVIDQKTFQDKEFSIDGEKYVVIDGFHDNRNNEYREVAFTYQLQVLFFYLNSGYYYELTDDTMSFSLYDTDSIDSIFCKEEEKEAIIEYYDNVTFTWMIDNTVAINNSDFDDLIAMSKSDARLILSGSEGDSFNPHDIYRLSEDKLIKKDCFTIYEYYTTYYLFDEYYYDYNLGENVYSLIPLTDAINDLIEETILGDNKHNH